MSNERDELFQLMLGRTTTKAVERILAAGYRKPRTITTAAPEPVIGISITAVDLESTRREPLDGRHQYRIGSATFIYFNPAIAQQWIAELSTITESSK